MVPVGGYEVVQFEDFEVSMTGPLYSVEHKPCGASIVIVGVRPTILDLVQACREHSKECDKAPQHPNFVATA